MVFAIAQNVVVVALPHVEHLITVRLVRIWSGAVVVKAPLAQNQMNVRLVQIRVVRFVLIAP